MNADAVERWSRRVRRCAAAFACLWPPAVVALLANDPSANALALGAIPTQQFITDRRAAARRPTCVAQLLVERRQPSGTIKAEERVESMRSEVSGDSTMPVVAEQDGGAAPPGWWLMHVFPVEDSHAFRLADSQRIVLGRDARADVVVTSHQVSRCHVALTVSGNELMAEDLGSLNGTFVNGQAIRRRQLAEGDILRVGDRLYVVTQQGAPSPESPTVGALADGLWAGHRLRAAVAPAQRVATTDLPVLIQGPTGTGKERVARAIHEWSRRTGPFVAINCAAIPEHLAEAELFGYRRGAFTGAERAAPGHLRAAHRGTLLLDEVSDLPLALQAKLLRVVEQNEVQPLGEAATTAIDVRIVAASQQPLDREVAAGRFRADLHARLNGVTISLPPLAERRVEIASLLVQLLRARLGGGTPQLDAVLVERLMLYAWPGNVRELDLLVRRLLGLHGHEARLRLEHLAGSQIVSASSGDSSDGATTALAHAPTGVPAHQRGRLSRDERDLQALLAGLRDHQGNLTKAAVFARISRQRAYRLLVEQSGFDLESFRKGSVA